MVAKDIKIIPRGVGNGNYRWDCKRFNITEADISLGLRHIKAKVRSEFRRLAKKYHPDTNSRGPKATQFKRLCRARERVLGLQTMLITMDNLETVLDITKGYKSTRECVLPWE